jgi:hypothetical protein
LRDSLRQTKEGVRLDQFVLLKEKIRKLRDGPLTNDQLKDLAAVEDKVWCGCCVFFLLWFLRCVCVCVCLCVRETHWPLIRLLWCTAAGAMHLLPGRSNKS